MSAFFLLKFRETHAAGGTLAQCQLKARSVEGVAYRESFAREDYPAGVTFYPKDASYREFIMLCMESNGLEFHTPTESALDGLDRCWLPDSKGLFPDANVDEADCYDARLW
jgi:hypothetical protein